MQDVEDKQNLDQFLSREGWLEYVAGNQPSDIVDACRMASAEESPGLLLQKAAIRYLTNVQPLIHEQQAFGLLARIAQISPT